MASVNISQEGYDRRIARIRHILEGFKLKATEITPLAYVENCPFPFNNFIYRVTLSPDTPIQAGNATFPSQPCTSPVSSSGSGFPTSIVIRLSNPAVEGLNNTNRVQNEVAAMYLTKQSAKKIAGLDEDIIPAVYAWAPYIGSIDTSSDPNIEERFGYIITEFKPGVDLDSVFWSLSLKTKKSVLGQMADLLYAVQNVQLPETTADKFGGVTINGERNIVAGGMTLLPGNDGGPFTSLSELWVARLRNQLAGAEKSSFLSGWRSSNLRIRERLEEFLQSPTTIDEILKGVDVTQRTLVHGDFTMNNILYDPSTNRITALLDFDWASINHASEEYFSGLWDIFGGLHEQNAKFREYILSGTFPDPNNKGPRPQDVSRKEEEEEQQQYAVAQVWSEISAKRGLTRPSTIPIIEKLIVLKELEGLICPFQLGNEAFLARMADDKKEKLRGETEGKIVAWLDKWLSED
ncbi:hypothetical protein V8F20_004115 [Naviculisporaceae sp. PSN 640]